MAPFWSNLNFDFLRSMGSNDGFVALDIGSSSIKMAEVAVEKNSYRVLKLGIQPLADTAIQNNMVIDVKAVADAIRQVVYGNSVKAKRVISAVPGRAVIMKKVQMPKQESAELEANIEFEAQNVIPENLENVNLDYQVLSKEYDSNRMEVLLVAVKKEIVNSYAEAIVAAGLEAAIMDVDYFALENMYETNYAADSVKGIIGLIHIGAQNTSISLLQDGISSFTGDLSIGGAYFTEALASQAGMTITAAESFKLTGGAEDSPELKLGALVAPTIEELAEEIRRTVSLYGAVPSDDGDSLKILFLSGGGAKLTGLREILEQRMGVPVRLSEPFRSFSLAKNIDRDYLLEFAPSFAVASGLSIRRPGDR